MKRLLFITLTFLNTSLFSQSVDLFRTVTAGGSVNAYTFTDATFSSYRPNEKWLVDFSAVTTNSGAATINRSNGTSLLGAKSIKNIDGTDPSSGQLIGRIPLSFNGTNFIIFGGGGSSYTASSGITLIGTNFSLDQTFTDNLYIKKAGTTQFGDDLIWSRITTNSKPYGIQLSFTGSGSGASAQVGINGTFSGGYTGTAGTVGQIWLNQNAGTSTGAWNGFPTSVGNIGLTGQSNASTTGNNYGIIGNATVGARNAGVTGLSLGTSNSNISIGIQGLARYNSGGAGVAVGVLGFLPSSSASAHPSLTAAAGLFDNGANSVDIINLRDNGVSVFAVTDGGALSLTGSTGTSGQVPMSNGPGNALTWMTPSGITNSAANNEFMKSNGTNAVASGVFSTSAGNVILGSTSISGTKSITVESSNTNEGLTISPKGTGDFIAANGSSNFFRATNGGTIFNNTTATALAPVHSSVLSSFTNTVEDLLAVEKQTTGTPANGIGSAIIFPVETTASNVEKGVRLKAVVRDNTAGLEYFDYVVETMAAGTAAAERAKINENGLIINTTTYGSSSLVPSSTYSILPNNVASANGWDLDISGGDVSSGNGNGGRVLIESGTHSGTGNNGYIEMFVENNEELLFEKKGAGRFGITAASSSTSTGETLEFYGGTPTSGNNNGGNILLSPGVASGSGINGSLRISSGSNLPMNRATLVGGTVTVNHSAVTANSNIFVFTQISGGTVGSLYISARTAGTSFTITSTSASDTSTVSWLIIEP